MTTSHRAPLQVFISFRLSLNKFLSLQVILHSTLLHTSLILLDRSRRQATSQMLSSIVLKWGHPTSAQHLDPKLLFANNSLRTTLTSQLNLPFDDGHVQVFTKLPTILRDKWLLERLALCVFLLTWTPEPDAALLAPHQRVLISPSDIGILQGVRGR
jgi:hypothetical protein